MINIELNKADNPTMLSIAGDLPNIFSLVGLLCAVLGIYFAILGNFSYAIIGVIWAVLFDWTDGIVARKLKGRTERQGLIGAQLDSLIDIVSFGVFPAVFLLSYGKFNPLFLPGAFLLVASSAVRLSYFNVYGLVDKKTYMGLALDNNVIILSLLFIFEGFFNQTLFSIILYIIMMVMMVINISPVKTPKFAGKWFYVLIAYTVILTILYGVII